MTSLSRFWARKWYKCVKNNTYIIIALYIEHFKIALYIDHNPCTVLSIRQSVSSISGHLPAWGHICRSAYVIVALLSNFRMQRIDLFQVWRRYYYRNEIHIYISSPKATCLLPTLATNTAVVLAECRYYLVLWCTSHVSQRADKHLRDLWQLWCWPRAAVGALLGAVCGRCLYKIWNGDIKQTKRIAICGKK